METDSPPSKAMIAKLIKLNGFSDKVDVVLSTFPLILALDLLKEKNIDMTKMIDLVNRNLPADSAARACHAVYSKYFTASEILDCIAFMKTSVGKKLIENDEAIRHEMLDEATKIAQEVVLKIAEEISKNEQNGIK